MSYAKNYKRTYMFRVYPNICQTMMELKPGLSMALGFDTPDMAKRIVNCIYSFQNAFFGKCRLTVTRNDKIIHISRPEMEVTDGSESS